MCEGVCRAGVKDSTDKKSGEVKKVLTLDYMGGSQYMTLEHPSQAALIKPGSFVKVEARVREFKDQKYPDRCIVLEVDEKKVPAIGGAS